MLKMDKLSRCERCHTCKPRFCKLCYIERIAQAKQDEREKIEQELLIRGGIATKEQIKKIVDKSKQDERNKVMTKLEKIMDVKIFRILKKELQGGAEGE